MALRDKNEPARRDRRDRKDRRQRAASAPAFAPSSRSAVASRPRRHAARAGASRPRPPSRSGRPLHVGTHQINGDEPSAEVEELRGQLAEAQKRERELRAAFAEQVEAYERKLSEEYDVSREQTKLDDRSAKLSSTESQIREREQRLASERQELNSRAPAAFCAPATKLQQPNPLPPSFRRSSRPATPS